MNSGHLSASGLCNSTRTNEHQTSSHSIQHLPVELLVHIFQFCLPHDLQDCRPSATEAPLLLCRVCALWKEIALRMPQLWTSLSVIIQRLSGESVDIRRHEEAANRWFQMAGTIPLSLNIYNVAITPSLINPKYSKDLGRLILLPHAAQIRNLELTFSLLDDILALSPLPQSFPNYDCLESLAIGLRFKIADTLLILMFQSAPRLRKVMLSQVNPSNILIPWAQLTELYINNICEFDLMILLARCTNLECGTFFVVRSLDGAPPTVSFVLPNLTRLTLVFCDNTWADCFRGSRFPTLDRLSIARSIRYWYQFYTDPVHLYRQLSAIRRLTVSNMSVPTIIDILRYSSSVSRLKAVWSEDDHGILFRALTIEDGSEDLLPNLLDLSIYCSLRRKEYFYLHMFLDMLRSRGPQRLTTSVSPLRRVKISVSIETSGEAQTLRKEIESAVQQSCPFGAPQLVFKSI